MKTNSQTKNGILFCYTGIVYLKKSPTRHSDKSGVVINLFHGMSGWVNPKDTGISALQYEKERVEVIWDEKAQIPCWVSKDQFKRNKSDRSKIWKIVNAEKLQNAKSSKWDEERVCGYGIGFEIC